MAPRAKILLLGQSGTGKSTFINAAAGKEVARVGHTLEKCTSETNAFTLTHPNKPVCEVVLIDTPGFEESWAEDKEILTSIVEWLKTTRTAPTGIIYLHEATRARNNLDGYTNAMHVKLFNHMITQSIVLVTTKWEYCRDKSAGDRRQEEPRNEWQGMLEHGLKVVRFADSQKSAWEIIDYFINNGPSSSEAIQVELERLLKDTFKTPNPRGGFFSHILGRFKGREGDTPKPAEIIAARTPEDADVPLPDNQGEPPRSPSLSSSILNLPPARSSKPPSPVVANHETRRPTFDNMASEGEPPRSPSLSSTRNLLPAGSSKPPSPVLANHETRRPSFDSMASEGEPPRSPSLSSARNLLPAGSSKPPPPVLANHETRRPRFDSMASEGEPPRSPLDSILNLPATSQPFDRAPEYVRGQAATADPREEQARTSEPVTPATPVSQNIWDFEEGGESERRSSERKPSFDSPATSGSPALPLFVPCTPSGHVSPSINNSTVHLTSNIEEITAEQPTIASSPPDPDPDPDPTTKTPETLDPAPIQSNISTPPRFWSRIFRLMGRRNATQDQSNTEQPNNIEMHTVAPGRGRVLIYGEPVAETEEEIPLSYSVIPFTPVPRAPSTGSQTSGILDTSESGEKSGFWYYICFSMCS